MLVQINGMKKLEKAVKPGNYNNLWCAGKSVAVIHDIKSCSEIVNTMESEMKASLQELNTIGIL